MIYYKITEAIDIYSIVFPIIIGIVKFSLSRPSYYYLFLSWLVCSGAINILNKVLVDSGINNLFVLHSYTLLEFTLLLLIYRSVIASKAFKRATVLSIVAFFIFKVLDVSIITGISKIDTLAMVIESVIMIVLSMFYSSRLIEKKDMHLMRLPIFWINAAVLVYFASSFFLFLYSTYIFSDAEQYYEYWSIHNILIIIRNILFTVAMLVLRKSTVVRSDSNKESVMC